MSSSILKNKLIKIKIKENQTQSHTQPHTQTQLISSTTMKTNKSITTKEKDKSIYKKISTFQNDLPEKIKQIIHILNSNEKDQNNLNYVRKYLLSLPTFEKFIHNSIKENLDECLDTIITYMTHKSLLYNSILFRFGDKGDCYYIILSGKVEIVLPKPKTYVMNKSEFIKHLYNLSTLGEKELVKSILTLNSNVFDFSEEENEFLLEIENLNDKKKGFSFIISSFLLRKSLLKDEVSYSNEDKDYHMLEHKHSIKSPVRRDRNRVEVSVEDYINSCTPIKTNDFSINNTIIDYKPVTILVYQSISSLGPGSSFGEVALISDYNKRSATCICTEDTELGIISKSIYSKSLKKSDLILYKRSLLSSKNNFLFENFPLSLFKKFIFNNVGRHKIHKENLLIKEMTEMDDNIYIINEGMYNVSMTTSIKNLQSMIEYYKDLIKDIYIKHFLMLRKGFIRKVLSLTIKSKRQRRIPWFFRDYIRLYMS